MLYIADEVFFSGTAAEITPIRSVDRIVVGKGSRGPVTEKLQKAFFDIVQRKRAGPLRLAHAGRKKRTRDGLNGSRATHSSFSAERYDTADVSGRTIRKCDSDGHLPRD